MKPFCVSFDTKNKKKLTVGKEEFSFFKEFYSYTIRFNNN